MRPTHWKAELGSGPVFLIIPLKLLDPAMPETTLPMASGPITAWPIEGEKVEVVTDFLFLGSKTTADSNCSHKFRRQLLLGGKAMTNLDSVLKIRDVTLPTEVHIVKAMVFPVIMYGCEIRTPKN